MLRNLAASLAIRLSAAGIALLLFSALIHAQTSSTGAIVGRVTDPSGAAVPQATINLLNMSTNASQVAVTNQQGEYSFPTVAPGRYQVTTTAAGFSVAVVSGTNVEVNTSSTINFSLKLGAVTQTAEVSASTAQVQLQTTDASIGDVVGSTPLQHLPTRLRQAQELTFLQPGTTPANGSDSGGSVAGAVNDQTTFTLDGIDITDNSTNSTVDSDHGARPVLLVSVEAIDEFRVAVANSNSTFSRASGGNVTLIGKSGSNAFHGGLFWYAQNSFLNTNSWDNKLLGLPKPHVEDNRYGGLIGGPIIKNKLFFFGEYEARRYPETFQVSEIVPTATLKQGILQFRTSAGAVSSYNLATSASCGLTGTTACDPRGLGISPTMKAMEALDPAGNNPNVAGVDNLNTTGLTVNAKSPLTDDFGTFRIDDNLTQKLHLNASFSYSRDIAYNSAPLVLDIRNPNNALNDDELPNWTNAFIAGLTYQINDHLINNFHFGDVRNRNGAYRPTLSSIAAELALPGTQLGNGTYVAVSPNIFTAPISMSNSVRTQKNDDRNLQFSDDLTWVKGNHLFQFGPNFQRIPQFHIHTGKVGGAVNAYNATETADTSFLTIPAANRPPTCTASVTTNCLPSASVSTWDSLYASTLGLMNDDNAFVVRNGEYQAQPIGSSLTMDALAYYYSFYAQDTWRIKPSLTFTYGLSYGWQTPYNFSNKLEAMLTDASSGQFISAKTYLSTRKSAAEQGQIYNPTFGFTPVSQVGRSGAYNTDFGDFAPRLAFAWQPKFDDGWLAKVTGSGKTVLRGGFGMYYSRLDGELAVVNPGLTAGPSSTVTTNLANCAATGSPAGGCNAGVTGNPGLSAFRIGVDGAIPVPSYPQAITSPYVPSNNFSELVSDGIDPYIKNPRIYSANLTLQRDLGKGNVLEVAWTGRFGRRLFQNVELNAAPYMFKDGSGQTFAGAYDTISNALRANQPIVAQPWFENQLPGVGSSAGYPSTTAYLAAVDTSYFTQGNVSSLFDSTSRSAPGIDALRVARGLAPFNTQQVTDLSIATNLGTSNYNALFVTLRRTMKSFTYDLNYTFSKSLDTAQGAQNDSTNLPNPLNPGVDYGPSIFDRRNTFNGFFVYTMPRDFSALPKYANAVLGNWYVSGIVNAVSGLPVYVTEGTQVWGGGTRSAGSTPAVPLVPIKQISTGVNYGVTGSGGIGTATSTRINLFANPQAVYNDFGYVQLSSNRDGYDSPLRGLPFWNVDSSLGKRVPIKEMATLQLSLDFFNLFNNVNFNNPTLPLTGSSISGFGVMSSTFVPENRQSSSRWIMFGTRLEF